jgi:hypothetical protein
MIVHQPKEKETVAHADMPKKNGLAQWLGPFDTIRFGPSRYLVNPQA